MIARDEILKRRARLVAAALASAGIAAGACGPTVCLSIACADKCGPTDAATDMMKDTQPMVCLTAPFDSGVDTGSDAPADAPADAPGDGSNEAG